MSSRRTVAPPQATKNKSFSSDYKIFKYLRLQIITHRMQKNMGNAKSCHEDNIEFSTCLLCQIHLEVLAYIARILHTPKDKNRLKRFTGVSVDN